MFVVKEQKSKRKAYSSVFECGDGRYLALVDSVKCLKLIFISPYVVTCRKYLSRPFIKIIYKLSTLCRSSIRERSKTNKLVSCPFDIDKPSIIPDEASENPDRVPTSFNIFNNLNIISFFNIKSLTSQPTCHTLKKQRFSFFCGLEAQCKG